MFFYSDDPAMDLIRYQDWQDSFGGDEDEGVICPNCGCSLEDYCFSVDGEYICQDCFDDAFKVEVTDDIVCECCGSVIDGDTAYLIDGEYHCKTCVEDNYHCLTPEFDD